MLISVNVCMWRSFCPSRIQSRSALRLSKTDKLKLCSAHRLNACRVVMMNLAISDWSFSLTLPLRLAYYFQGTRWNFPDWLCRLCTFGFYVNLYSR